MNNPNSEFQAAEDRLRTELAEARLDQLWTLANMLDANNTMDRPVWDYVMHEIANRAHPGANGLQAETDGFFQETETSEALLDKKD